MAARVPLSTSPPLGKGRRVASQPATTPVPEPELTVQVDDRPATGQMEETVIYSVDDYYTVQPVTPSSGHSSAIPPASLSLQPSVPSLYTFITIFLWAELIFTQPCLNISG